MAPWMVHAKVGLVAKEEVVRVVGWGVEGVGVGVGVGFKQARSPLSVW